MNKRIFMALPISLLGFACTDYVSEINSQHDRWVAANQQSGGNISLPDGNYFDPNQSTLPSETPSYTDTPTNSTPTSSTSTNSTVVTGCRKSPQIMFNGTCKDYRVKTGFERGYIESGYWFSYNDNADGGLSSWNYPVSLGNIYDDAAIDPVVDYCKGLCGSVALNSGILDYNPFVGVGFNIAGPNIAVDVSSWGGVCVTYTSDLSLSLEMGLTDLEESYYSYDLPFVFMKASSTPIESCYSWSSFKQAGWGAHSINGTVASLQLVALKFKAQGRSGFTGFVNILSISKVL